MMRFFGAGFLQSLDAAVSLMIYDLSKRPELNIFFLNFVTIFCCAIKFCMCVRK